MVRWLLIGGLVLLGGCGRSGVQTVPVHGKITLDGGSWPSEGTIYFAPIKAADGFPTKPGTAQFATDGTFKAKTFVEGDGLIPGTYAVNVECWINPPSMDAKAPPAKSAVPAKYQSSSQSGFQVIVPADGRSAVEVDFDVPKS